MTEEFSVLERYRDIVDDWGAFVAALGRPLPTTAWVNPARTTRAEVIKSLAMAGVHCEPIGWREDAFTLPEGYRPGSRYESIAGLMQVQEEAAMIPVCLMDLEAGDRVLDLCAAPGNKTAQIAVELNSTGTVVANDRNYQRMRAIRNTADRLGLLNIAMTHCDAVNYPVNAGLFDAILADVPCSCEGTSRKNPKTLRKGALQSIAKLGGTQRAILSKAFQLLRPGGRLVYSTCTYAPEENEAVVADVLEELDYVPTWIPARIEGFRSSPGILEWAGRSFPPEMELAMRVWPHHNDTGGFFVAVFERPL